MAKVVLRIELPDEIVRKYEWQAKRAKKELEEFVSKRLVSSVSYHSEKPLYITDDQRQTIEKLLHKNLDSPVQLIVALEKLVDLDVGGTTVDISPKVLERLKTRCFGRPYRQVLTEQVVHGLEQFVGLR